MRILLIAPEIIDTHTRRLLQMLLDSDNVVTCVGRDDPKPEGNDHFTFIKYPEVYFSKRIRPQKLRRAMIEWGIALRLRQIWRHVKPDIVHVIYINLQAYHCALAGLHPLVLTALGTDINARFEEERDDAERRKKIAKALQAADHVTADAREVLDRCEILAGRPLNSSLFYFGIDLDLFRPRSEDEKFSLRKKLGIPSGSKIILSPRRLTPKMNQDLVLMAFSELIRRSSLDVVLLFRRFGFLSVSLEAALRELAGELGINDRVIWVDEMDYSQIPVLYSLADLVLNIPEQDGLPVTLFEASACMTPVITSDLPAYQDYLSDGAYYRVGVGDTDGVVDAIQTILGKGSQSMLESLQKNYDLATQKADQKICFSGMEQIYQGLVR